MLLTPQLSSNLWNLYSNVLGLVNVVVSDTTNFDFDADFAFTRTGYKTDEIGISLVDDFVFGSSIIKCVLCWLPG